MIAHVARSPTLVHTYANYCSSTCAFSLSDSAVGPLSGLGAACGSTLSGCCISGTRDDTIAIGARGRATSKGRRTDGVLVRAGRASESSDGAGALVWRGGRRIIVAGERERRVWRRFTSWCMLVLNRVNRFDGYLSEGRTWKAAATAARRSTAPYASRVVWLGAIARLYLRLGRHAS